MKNISQFLQLHRQNHKLAIRLISPGFGHLPSFNLQQYGLTHRKPYYFFLFMIDGTTIQTVDLQRFEVSSLEMLFILPHQIHQLPKAHSGKRYYKLGFDPETLSLLPKQYAFLVNPLNSQKIRFTRESPVRIEALFAILQNLLQEMDTDPDLILAHLNSLLVEINAAYFLAEKQPAAGKLSIYIQFKTLVEETLTDHLPLRQLAERLGISINTLYSIAKTYSGLSPKEFITNRLMLEAKRRLFYSESTSIKSLAYDLGYTDPEYFSRLFKKYTGKTVSAFMQDLSGND